jgi:hypothetical protein
LLQPRRDLFSSSFRFGVLAKPQLGRFLQRLFLVYFNFDRGRAFGVVIAEPNFISVANSHGYVCEQQVADLSVFVRIAVAAKILLLVFNEFMLLANRFAQS